MSSDLTHRPAIVVMGVSGCGKSSVGAALAASLGLTFIDGDSLHGPDNIARMSAGIPLTDEDRWPWLQRVGAALADRASHPAGVVIACSALKRAYRDLIRKTVGAPMRFAFLDGEESLLIARQAARTGHFMPPSLILSQLTTLERPAPDETDVTRVDIAEPVETLVTRLVTAWSQS